MSRDSYNISSLEVLENNGQPVQNVFIQQKEPTGKLALVYPGLRYSSDKPLLYYTTEVLLARGYDVLQLWANYGLPEFQSLSQAEKSIQLIEDGKALLHSGLQASTYSNLVMVGKSLGTLTMAFILGEDLQIPTLMTVWFTPLFHIPQVSQVVLGLSGPAFIAGSDVDPTFESGAVSQLKSLPNIKTQVIEGADHSLEIPGEPLRSTQILHSLMANLTDFLN
jgi:hypothetical protein